MGVTVKAEMAGVVAAVEIEEGASVTGDDAVLILSAMKMEIPVMAGKAGTLAELLVGEGDVVKAGEALFVIEG